MIDDRLIECVPNFSEGRDQTKVDSIAEAIKSVALVDLLHIDVGYDANRSVFTLVGPPNAIIEAVTKGFVTASQVCNMAKHLGTHPRIGLLDVCPLIPIRNISLSETSKYAELLAQQLAAASNQTTFLYEASAKFPDRKNLSNIRKGEYEGLKRKLKSENWVPDYGSKAFLSKTGASIIGARPFLVAFNINLKSSSDKIANGIAKRIRASGYTKELTPGGLKQRVPGLLPAIKALGWYVDEYKIAQVTMNLVDFEINGMHEAFEACKYLAKEKNVGVSGSELIGLVPLNALLQSGRYYATRDHLPNRSESSLIQAAIKGLGLNDLRPFIPESRIIEYRMSNKNSSE